MVANKITKANFNYQKLDEDSAAYLQERAAYINARIALTHQFLVEIGRALIDAKALYPGVWQAWISSEFNFSVDSAENYMNVAKNMPDLPAGTSSLFRATSLYHLSKPGADETGRKLAAALAESGEAVPPDVAYILANAPATIRDSYLAFIDPLDDSDKKPITNQTYHLVKALRRRGIPDEVYRAAIKHKVAYGEVVEYLNETYKREKQSAGSTRPANGWTALKDNDFNLNGLGWSIPLREARPIDIERYKADRQTLRRDKDSEIYDWYRTDGEILLGKGGKPIIDKDGSMFIKVIDPRSITKVRGKVLVDIRVPRSTN